MKKRIQLMRGDRGFTLIELLVVIAIIAILVAFVSSNFLGARQRAKDIKKKSEMNQVKNALRLYYNDFSVYPGPNYAIENQIYGCGTLTPPSDPCSICAGAFAAGPTTGCENVFMKLLPPSTDYVWEYQQQDDGDNFCLAAELENASDSDLARSQARCLNTCGAPSSSRVYMVCSD
jgi:prepilin-type N-terminal cleavage/methylation domain-containing protein